MSQEIESEFNRLNISSDDSNPINLNCTYCKKPFAEELWCKECDQYKVIEGWTSGNPNVDKLIKDIMHDAKPLKFLEWVPFDRFTDIKEIGEGGFSKVYTATWIDGNLKFEKTNDESWKRLDSEPMEVVLKRLNGSQNVSTEFLHELKIHWDVCNSYNSALKFYGLTKDPVTKEFMMIVEFASMGNLRSNLSKNFINILWKDKIKFLLHLIFDLAHLHSLEYCHKDFHSGNILQNKGNTYLSDFGLSRPTDKQKSSKDQIYGVLPYIAPEVLNREPYTLASDIYSFGVIMTELSSGTPPFHNRKHDITLALDVCNGLCPEFGKGTPEFYKKLAYKCMNAIPIQRPTINDLRAIWVFWYNSIYYYEGFKNDKKYGYYGREIKKAFEEADKEIVNISTSYKNNPDAIYTSRAFTFNNLAKPTNSSLITSYLKKDDGDSQIIDLEFLAQNITDDLNL